MKNPLSNTHLNHGEVGMLDRVVIAGRPGSPSQNTKVSCDLALTQNSPLTNDIGLSYFGRSLDVGTIPPELGKLEVLEVLDLRGEYLSPGGLTGKRSCLFAWKSRGYTGVVSFLGSIWLLFGNRVSFFRLMTVLCCHGVDVDSSIPHWRDAVAMETVSQSQDDRNHELLLVWPLGFQCLADENKRYGTSDKTP